MAAVIKRTKSEKVFDLINYLILIVLAVSTVFPFIYLFSLSISSQEVSFTQFHIIPPKISFKSYLQVFTNKYIGYGFKNTIIRTVLGTLLSVFVTTLSGYVLSKKYFPHRNFWTMFIVFTMFFQGGLIPRYLLVRNLGLINSYWALVLPGLINTFYMIIARNFFMTLPESIEESAKIDGANTLQIFFKIIVPMSKAIIATLTLWTAVGHWNAWFDSMIYTTEPKMHVLMIVMRRIVLQGLANTMDPNMVSLEDMNYVNPETLKAATIMVTTLPIIMFYPFLQKYFVKGVMVGSLKG